MIDKLLKVQIVYASPDKQNIISLELPSGTSIEQAITLSNIQIKFPEIDLSKNVVGIFGKPKPLDTIVQDRDRIEIYRPLLANPKEIRRKRAATKTKKENR